MKLGAALLAYVAFSSLGCARNSQDEGKHNRKRYGTIIFMEKYEADHYELHWNHKHYQFTSPDCSIDVEGTTVDQRVEVSIPESCPAEISLEGFVASHDPHCPPARFMNRRIYADGPSKPDLVLKTVGLNVDIPKTYVPIPCSRE